MPIEQRPILRLKNFNIDEIGKLIEAKSKLDDIKIGQDNRLLQIPATKFKWKNQKKADGIPILARQGITESDPNIKLAYDNYSLIANTKAGYLGGDITRVYNDGISEQVKDKYKGFDRLNNTKSFFKNLMVTTSSMGLTFSLNFLEEREVYIKEIKPFNCFVIYNPKTGKPTHGVIYSQEEIKNTTNDKLLRIWVYNDFNVFEYEFKKSNYVLVSSDPHGFTQMPIIKWSNNNFDIGNSEKTISLLDAWDRLTSDNATEWATFRNAYLMLKNMGLISEEVKAKMKKTGVIIGREENSEVKFITKDVNPEFSKLVLETVWNGIWVVASSVDPKALATLSNATAFQIGQLYNLMENDSKNTEMEWKIALQFLDEILKSYWTVLDVSSISDYDTYEINYEFPRNKPKDELSDLEALLRAGGRLPQEEIFRRAGYPEEKAKELAEEAQKEVDESLPEIDE